MSAESTRERCQCLCGAVQFEVGVKAREMGVCHCSMCRRWSGGAFMAVGCENVTFQNEAAVGVYSSSEWGERCFCKACGSTLMWRSKDGEHQAVSVQTFADPGSFRFASQIFIDEKPASYSFAETTRNMTGAEVMAAFSGGAQQ